MGQHPIPPLQPSFLDSIHYTRELGHCHPSSLLRSSNSPFLRDLLMSSIGPLTFLLPRVDLGISSSHSPISQSCCHRLMVLKCDHKNASKPMLAELPLYIMWLDPLSLHSPNYWLVSIAIFVSTEVGQPLCWSDPGRESPCPRIAVTPMFRLRPLFRCCSLFFKEGKPRKDQLPPTLDFC